MTRAHSRSSARKRTASALSATVTVDAKTLASGTRSRSRAMNPGSEMMKASTGAAAWTSASTSTRCAACSSV